MTSIDGSPPMSVEDIATKVRGMEYQPRHHRIRSNITDDRYQRNAASAPGYVGRHRDWTTS